jgi:hypothetical protein
MAFIKICRDIPNLVKIEQKCQALYMQTQGHVLVARNIKTSEMETSS